MGSESKFYINKDGELCQYIDSRYHKQVELLVQGFTCQAWTEKAMYAHLNILNYIKPTTKPVIR